MVIERVGTIEGRWAAERRRRPDRALEEALFRLRLLQDALRRRLLSPAGRFAALNRHDPTLTPPSFDDLDAMAELLWEETGAAA